MIPVLQRTDEELLYAHRVGEALALNELFFRYQRRFRPLFNSLIPQNFLPLESAVLQDVQERAFFEAIAAYQFIGVRFISFYSHILKKDLLDLQRKRRNELLTFQFGFAPEDEEEAGVHPIENAPTLSLADDPCGATRYALLYSDVLRGCAESRSAKVALDIFRLISIGYRPEEISNARGISINKVKYELRKFRRWAMHVIRRSVTDSYAYENERKTIDAFCDDVDGLNDPGN